MLELLQTYGFWIVLALGFVLMLRMHGGGGCGMSHDQQRASTPSKGMSAESGADRAAEPKAPTGPAGGCH